MTGARAQRTLPTAARGVVVGSTMVGLLLTAGLADWSGLVFFAAFGGIGAYLVIQRPANSVGWFLMLSGYGLAIGSVRCTASLDAMLSGHLTPIEVFSTWVNGCGWAIALTGFFGITQVFPSGRMPTGRARWLSRIGFGAMIALTAWLAFAPVVNVVPTQTGTPVDVPNPLAVLPEASFWSVTPEPVVLYPVMFVIVVAGVVGLVVRARRSAGLERLQYRWLIAALVFLAAANFVWAVVTYGLEGSPTGPAFLGVVVAYLAVPVAVVVAVLRYRLYEIDRIISRTIAYVIVSAVLLTMFTVAVLLLSATLASVAGGQSIAVAGSTLIAYAAFQPIIGRVRRTVDRRFDRARYDGERTATVFAARLRDETDVDAVVHDLATTTRMVVAPSSLSLWLRPRDVIR